jgi:hypothetical protein
MCEAYEGYYIDYIFPISSNLLYFNELCISYDISTLTFVTIIRLFIYLFIYFLIITHVDIFGKYYKYLDNIFLIIVFLNGFSLFITLIKNPKFIKRTLTNENKP